MAFKSDPFPQRPLQQSLLKGIPAINSKKKVMEKKKEALDSDNLTHALHCVLFSHGISPMLSTASLTRRAENINPRRGSFREYEDFWICSN